MRAGRLKVSIPDEDGFALVERVGLTREGIEQRLRKLLPLTDPYCLED